MLPFVNTLLPFVNNHGKSRTAPRVTTTTEVSIPAQDERFHRYRPSSGIPVASFARGSFLTQRVPPCDVLGSAVSRQLAS